MLYKKILILILCFFTYIFLVGYSGFAFTSATNSNDGTTAINIYSSYTKDFTGTPESQPINTPPPTSDGSQPGDETKPVTGEAAFCLSATFVPPTGVSISNESIQISPYLNLKGVNGVPYLNLPYLVQYPISSSAPQNEEFFGLNGGWSVEQNNTTCKYWNTSSGIPTNVSLTIDINNQVIDQSTPGYDINLTNNGVNLALTTDTGSGFGTGWIVGLVFFAILSFAFIGFIIYVAVNMFKTRRKDV